MYVARGSRCCGKECYSGPCTVRAASNCRLNTRSSIWCRRQREPGDVYAERLSRVFYENYIGSIVDWYAATLFRREPVLMFEGDERVGQRILLRALVDDVDRKGTGAGGFLAEAVRGERW